MGRTCSFSFRLVLLFAATLMVVTQPGCRTTVPIHVWHPPEVTSPLRSRVALATVSSDPVLSQALESAMFQQRPVSRADLSLITSQQLLESTPVRYASTATTSGMIGSDLQALRYAQKTGANLLLYGQVYSCDIDWKDDSKGVDPARENMNKSFFQRLGAKPDQGPDRHIVLSWNIFEVSSGKSIGSQQFRLSTHEVAKKYPDLQYLADRPSMQLLEAAARQSWKSVTPTVDKVDVRLSSPLFQPGSLRVLMGVRAAKKGQWQTAENYWKSVANSWLPAPAAHHNLAVALAAKEDFASAKQELLKARGPMSFRLPSETLLWLDQYHRSYNQSHQLGQPSEGWAFPQIVEISNPSQSVRPIDEAQVPWWAGLPFLRYRP